MLRNSLSWLRVKFDIIYFRPGNVMTHQNYVSALKRNCNVMARVGLYRDFPPPPPILNKQLCQLSIHGEPGILVHGRRLWQTSERKTNKTNKKLKLKKSQKGMFVPPITPPCVRSYPDVLIFINHNQIILLSRICLRCRSSMYTSSLMMFFLSSSTYW